MKHETFTEKYRPKSIRDVIGCPIPLLKLLDSPEKLDHILLYSVKAGTGKTSIMKAIVKDFDGVALFMNASDERKIEDIRDKVKRFCQTSSFDGKRKFVCLDEIDGMLRIPQEALKTIMERYNVTFILTANRVEKIIEPLQSRCKGFKFNLQFPPKDKCFEKLKDIVEKEHIIISDEALDKLVSINYPSLRDMIKQLQMLSLSKETINVNDVEKEDEVYKKLYDMVKIGKVSEARKEWLEMGFDLRYTLKQFFLLVLADEGLINRGKIITVIADTDYRMALTADPDISLFYGMLKVKALLK